MASKDDAFFEEADISMGELTEEKEQMGRDVVSELPATGSLSKIGSLRQRAPLHKKDLADPEPGNAPPPSFAQSEFEMIIRRQRNNQPHMLKIHDRPSRFPNLDNLWEFAGWGSMSYVELTDADLGAAAVRLARPKGYLTTLQATSIAGNDMYGSVFYAFPAVAAVAGVLSPISLLVACLLLFVFRPIWLELGSGMRFNGAIYAYFLQCSGKTMALVAVAAMFLDGVATASVAAATVSAYISGEVNGALFGMKEAAVAIGILILLATIGLFGLKESSGVTLSFTIFHLTTMTMLILASLVAWGREGNSILTANWALRPAQAGEIAKAIFYGVCIAFLGVTGFEMTPTYLEDIRPEAYNRVITSCIYTVTTLNAPLMLFVYALLPSDEILSGGNVLSLLAEKVAGKWLRYIVIIDCALVVGGGCIMAGMIGMVGTLQMLARNHEIPQLFLKTLPTGSAYWSVGFFVLLSIILYASSGFNLATISGVFSVSFPFVMLMYCLANLLLKFNRDRLPRQYQASLGLTVLGIMVIIVVIVGNVVLSPKILGLFLAYFLAILACLLGLQSRIKLGRIAMWLYNHVTVLHQWKRSKGWGAATVKWMARVQKRPIAVWVKSDDIHNIVTLILYVKKNELTSRIIFVHAYASTFEIPTELEANVKILDEAFPSITLDLVFVKGVFNPTLVDAVSAKLDVPKSQMFMNTMGSGQGYTLADYEGVRVVSW